MDRNKLLSIIQKDLDELNEITNEMAGKSQLSTHEIEFALGKSRIVCQEFDYLKELNQQLLRSELQEFPKVSPLVKEFLEGKPVKEQDSELTDNENEPVTDEAEQDADAGAGLSGNEQQNEGWTNEEITEPFAPKKTVAEIYVQEKSLNDILSSGKTIDHKLSGSPVVKLEAAIGLNDRFQFIRELFGNDAGLFNQTVKQIDQMENIGEAVAFLNSHFKWKKNETSMKFAQLVKRRFSN